MARIIEIPAVALPVGVETIDGFTVEYKGKVRDGQIAYRGITREGRIESRVWNLGDLVPCRD
jgi:hypothetical protein